MLIHSASLATAFKEYDAEEQESVIAGKGSQPGDGWGRSFMQPTPPAMPKTEAAADERDMLAVISRLVVAQMLCSNAECCKPLQTVLQCAKCEDASYCSKDCQVGPYHHTLFAH
jgi:hypothetical protein